jgi:hypothetical protein
MPFVSPPTKKGSYECGGVGIFGDCVRGEDEEVEMEVIVCEAEWKWGRSSCKYNL